MSSTDKPQPQDAKTSGQSREGARESGMQTLGKGMRAVVEHSKKAGWIK